MPDDLAKRINEVVNKKPITPEDELQDALDEIARDIVLIELDPVDWGGCDIISNILPPIADDKLTQTINHHFECIYQ